MNTPTIDSFIGTWKGAPENGMSLITIDVKKENEQIVGTFRAAAPGDIDNKRAMEASINFPRIQGSSMLFKPNPNGPGIMALELVGENEAIFGPVIDPDDIDKHFEQMAKHYREQFGREIDRSMHDPNSPEIIASVKSHQVRLVRQ